MATGGLLPRNNLLALILITLLVAGFASAQQTQAAADKLLSDSQWDQAAAAYKEITTREPGNGPAWAGLGDALLNLGKYDDSVVAFTHAVELNDRPVRNQVKIAGAYARKGDRAQMLNTLQQVVGSPNAGRALPLIVSAQDFAAYTKDEQFRALLDQLRPCKAGAYRQFDFWIGDWDVQSPTGQPLGSNLVTNEQDGCLLIEHWHSGRGVESGTSFNYYDIHDKKWHQLYIDNLGDAESYPPLTGELRDGKMVLLTEVKDNAVSRWTWYLMSPGHVRQMAEQSSDGGKTWQTTWDSVYVKK